MDRHSTGRRGEYLAEQFLLERGYRIVKRNFRLGRHGEIDLIAYDGAALVFIEVKYRRTATYGTPEDAVTADKRQQLRRIAEGFLAITALQAREYRFDVIAIEEEADGSVSIRHWKNAFW
ncbi:MAG: YraN family protein [Chlorobiota bacterium]|jgi:putative endonuclease|nr:MAG: YraN family protein [Chlorobiota bacterium]